MSFNHYAHKVRDSHISHWGRLAALRSCISRLASLKGESYFALLASLNQKYDFDRYKDRQLDVPPDENSLIATLNEVETEREKILIKLRIFDEERVQKKKRGNRHLSTQEQEQLQQLRQT